MRNVCGLDVHKDSQFKSMEGAQQYAMLQSIVQTAHKCSQDPIEALIAVAEL